MLEATDGNFEGLSLDSNGGSQGSSERKQKGGAEHGQMTMDDG